eukprot:Em0013g17a
MCSRRKEVVLLCANSHVTMRYLWHNQFLLHRPFSSLSATHLITHTGELVRNGQATAHLDVSCSQPPTAKTGAGPVNLEPDSSLQPRYRYLARKHLGIWMRRTFGRELPHVADQHHTLSLERRVFSAWREVWWCARWEWKLVIRADCHNRYRLWLRVWKAWSLYVRAKKEKKRKKKVAGELAAINLERCVWLAWCEYVAVRKQRRDQRREAQEWYNGHMVRLAWGMWRRAIGFSLQRMAAETLAHQCWVHSLQRRELQQSPLRSRIDNQMHIDIMSAARRNTLKIFLSRCKQKWDGPYYGPLHDVLGAYACYRPDIGYVQGMSFLAGMLLLNMEPSDAFICLANLLNRPSYVAFFKVDHALMKPYFTTFSLVLQDILPRLSAHFNTLQFIPEFISLNGILKLGQKELAEFESIPETGQYLGKFASELSSEVLFESIASVPLSAKHFHQILQQQTGSSR